MSQVEVTLKSGKAIPVMRDEVQGLRDAGLIDESKLSAELKKPLKKEDGTKVTGTASVGNIPKKPKKPIVPIGYVNVELKSGGAIKVKKHEVKGLQEAGLLKAGKSRAEKAQELADKEAKKLADQEAKEKEEKEKTETKEEKGTGTITKDNIKG